ncbi:MAG: hypothetical protein JSU70_20250 [Phycisphaerales bacterium]|nr:MAG: hypothetical protein JSU70_20250 [Phycisphaerales bacterium]
MAERGTTKEEVAVTVEEGERFDAKFGRVGFRRNFVFDSMWGGKYYKTKQIEAFAFERVRDWLVVSVITRYF